MPSTINASNTTGGVITTGDGSGVLELQSGGTTGLTINGANVTVAGTLTTTGKMNVSNLTGTLPIANGGTNTTATPTAGAVPYGTGTALAYTSAGTSGQVLTSAGAGAPTWSTPAGTAWTLISSVTPAVGDPSVTFSSIPQTYADLLVIINGVSHNAGGTGRLRVLGSYNNGTNFALQDLEVAAHAATDFTFGSIFITGYTTSCPIFIGGSTYYTSTTPGTINFQTANSTSVPVVLPLGSGRTLNWISFNWSNGNFDAGSIALYGR